MSPKPSRALDKKTQILRAARSVVMDGGFRELQMNAVAAAAGVAVGTIYRYFPSRAELCAAIVSVTSQREVDVLSGIAVAEGEPSRKVRDAVRTFAARAMRGRRLAYGLIFEPIDPEVESTRLKYRRAIARVFETIIREGIAAGEFRDVDVEVAGAFLVGAFMEGLVGSLAPDTGGIQERADEIADAIADLCLAAVAKPGHPLLNRAPRTESAAQAIPLRPRP
ncbi:TetR family transcriptional regulator [Azospirillum agricola]|uniref:TetR family transcriptional regulator n=1 Tax=Azospirillum agricola TaxID=1720247 RepID=UPI000A0F32FF|nr:TetR family transcriptional regulator [Azospirillum agricola]SMH29014.1 transcriptional regulator, TetR family [Azospirillum lipoferum]